MAEMLTTVEVAARLGVDPSRVRHWVREGRLPAHKHGRDLFVSAADLDCFRRPPMGRPRKERWDDGDGGADGPGLMG